jgi:hypothetical protein
LCFDEDEDDRLRFFSSLLSFVLFFFDLWAALFDFEFFPAPMDDEDDEEKDALDRCDFDALSRFTARLFACAFVRRP